jgi:hypothetical protein
MPVYRHEQRGEDAEKEKDEGKSDAHTVLRETFAPKVRSRNRSLRM